MRTTNFRFQSSQSVLELRHTLSGAINYYFNSFFVRRYPSEETAFADLHGRTLWPEDLLSPPHLEGDWQEVPGELEPDRG